MYRFPFVCVQSSWSLMSTVALCIAAYSLEGRFSVCTNIYTKLYIIGQWNTQEKYQLFSVFWSRTILYILRLGLSIVCLDIWRHLVFCVYEWRHGDVIQHVSLARWRRFLLKLPGSWVRGYLIHEALWLEATVVGNTIELVLWKSCHVSIGCHVC